MSKTHCDRCATPTDKMTDLTVRGRTFWHCKNCSEYVSVVFDELCQICKLKKQCPSSIGVSGSTDRVPLCADCVISWDKSFEDMEKRANGEQREKEQAIWDFHATQYLHSIEGTVHKMRTPTSDAADAAQYASEMMRYRKRCA